MHRRDHETNGNQSCYVAVPYKPPDFATRVQSIPKERLELCMKPTPIHPWPLQGLPADVRVSIKRDDMTASTAGGNKIRKLEFLLADALLKKCTCVITAGSVQSNHARATAVLAKELGMHPHVFLRTKDTAPEAFGFDGNVLLNRLVGASIYLIKPQPYITGLLPKMKTLAEKLSREEAQTPYIIGIGGSNSLGMWGYIECFRELMQQNVHNDFSDVVVPIGSGGTATGLAIGNYLAGSPLRVHAISVCDDPPYFYEHVDEMLAAAGLREETSAADILNIIDAKGRGYAKSTPEELALCTSVARDTGIILDRVYTGKAVKGMVQELRKPRHECVFQTGARILFVHTGGIFSVFDREIEAQLRPDSIMTWPEEL